jgi:hypothetical protein
MKKGPPTFSLKLKNEERISSIALHSEKMKKESLALSLKLKNEERISSIVHQTKR